METRSKTEKLRAAYHKLKTPSTTSVLTEAEMNQPDFGIFQVEPKTAQEVINTIAEVKSTWTGKLGLDPRFRAPSCDTNSTYVKKYDRIVLKDGIGVNFGPDKKAKLLKLMDHIANLCRRDIYIDLRSLYYMHKEHFKNSTQVHNYVDDLACMIRCPRFNLHLSAPSRGLYAGNFVFCEGMKENDCSEYGVEGFLIPKRLDGIGVRMMETETKKAAFILVMEKETIFTQLIQDRFTDKVPCILVCGRGQPSVATRRFVRMLSIELDLIAVGLFDSNPEGIAILSTYLHGSANMSYDSKNLVTPGMWWIGLRPSQVRGLELAKYGHTLTKKQRAMLTKMKTKPEFLGRPKWWDELKIMGEMNVAVDIDVMSYMDYQYISENFLVNALETQDWI